MCATVSVVSVQSPTCAPRRAAAYAASHPRARRRSTITSKRFMSSNRLQSFPDAEPREDVLEQIVRRAAAGDFLERRARILQIGEHELLRERSAVGAAAARARASARSCARSTSAMCRTFVIAGRSRSRLDVERRDESRRRSASSPAPVVAPTPTHRRVVAPRGGQIALVCDDNDLVPSAVEQLIASPRPAARSVRPAAPDRRRRCACARARRLRPRRSRRSSRRPAVSTSVTRRPSRSTASVTRSRVVPGTSVTIARDAPASALNRLDLPTFGSPTIATCSPSRISRPRRASAEQRVGPLRAARRATRASSPGSTK